MSPRSKFQNPRIALEDNDDDDDDDEWSQSDICKYILKNSNSEKDIKLHLQECLIRWPHLPVAQYWEDCLQESFDKQEFISDYSSSDENPAKQIWAEVMIASADGRKEKGPSWPRKPMAGNFIDSEVIPALKPREGALLSLEEIERARKHAYEILVENEVSKNILQAPEWSHIFPNTPSKIIIQRRRFKLTSVISYQSWVSVESPCSSELTANLRPVDIYTFSMLKSYDANLSLYARTHDLMRTLGAFIAVLSWSNLRQTGDGRYTVSELEQATEVCPFCLDYSPKYNMVRLSKCSHAICLGCVKEAHSQSLKDISFTPSCCHHDFPDCTLPMVLSEDELSSMSSMPSRRFIGAVLLCFMCEKTLSTTSVSNDDIAFCDFCKVATCIRCGGPKHKGICMGDVSTIEILKKLGKNWVICPRCRNLIEKSGGCNHIDCLCGASICYLCSGTYNSCKCRGTGAFGQTVRQLVRETESLKGYEAIALSKADVKDYQKQAREAEAAKNARLVGFKECSRYMSNVYKIVEYVETLLARVNVLHAEYNRIQERILQADRERREEARSYRQARTTIYEFEADTDYDSRRGINESSEDESDMDCRSNEKDSQDSIASDDDSEKEGIEEEEEEDLEEDESQLESEDESEDESERQIHTTPSKRNASWSLPSDGSPAKRKRW